MKKIIFISSLLFLIWSFSKSFSNKGIHKYCFKDRVKEDTAERYEQYFLEVNLTKKTFRYEILAERVSRENKWISLSVYSGKAKESGENKLTFTTSLFTQRKKFEGHVFDEQKSEAQEKLLMDTKENSLYNQKNKQKVFMYSCPHFSSDSLGSMFEHWKN
ncbi:MAG: hypothetical protein IAF38_16735 [Bacteroidia bacterium]|nr:hypothetical protein [Bacteroidia bacterium]